MDSHAAEFREESENSSRHGSQSHASRFWRETEEYHDLARTFEQNVERVHPGSVTSDRMCPWCYWCSWAATAVDYYEYRGPSVIRQS